MDGAGAPLTGEHIVCISSIDWDFIWQGHQTIMSALAAAGNRILFIDNTGVRSPRVRDVARVRHRITNWRRGVGGFRRERDNLDVYSPLVLPFPYSRVVRWANVALLMRSLRRWMRATGFRPTVVWTFLPTPLARALARALAPQVTVYYCYGDFPASSAGARRIARSEARMFREADLVFAVSESLVARALRFRPQAEFFPSGVDFARFEAVAASGQEPPDDLRALRPPIAAYVGGLHQWIDQPLLAETAQRLPDVSFALIGPIQTDLALLRRLPNVHVLGPRPHDEIPRYLKGAQAAIIPYRVSAYTADVYPAKLCEYLAMGLPVITTELPAIRSFEARHPGTVAIATTGAQFAEAVRGSVAGDAPAEAKNRIDVARTHDWSARVAEMARLVAGALGHRRHAARRWELRLTHIYRRARRQVVGTTAGLLAAYLLVFHTPLVWVAAEPLRRADAPRPAEAIVVFAGGVGESGVAGQGYQERVEWAAELYRAGYAPRVVFSSGDRYAFREVDVMQALALSLGIPADAILIEDKAGSTADNVRFSAAILAREGWRSAILVSSPYNMRRASLVFRRLAPEIDVTYSPVPRSLFFHHGVGVSARQIRAILHEYVAIAVYAWRGWI